MNHAATAKAPVVRYGELIFLLALMAAAGPLAIDTYLPSLPTIALEFGVSAAVVQQSVSAYFFGLAGGQLIAGPLSDHFGRRIILFGGFTLFLLASAVCALAPDADVLVAARVVQGLGASASSAAGRAVIRDLWSGNRAARAMSFVMMVMSLAPLLAPIVGGQIFIHLGWRSIFWLLVGFAVLILLLIATRLPETNGPERRAGKRLGSDFRAYGRVLASGHAWSHLLCGGCSSAVMFAYITGTPVVYIQVFGVQPEYFGFLFALNVIGMVLGNFVNSRLVIRHGHLALIGAGTLVTAGATALLWLSAVTTTGGLIAVVVTLLFAIAPVGMVGANTVAGLLDHYPENAGAASALFGVFQFGVGGLASVAVGLLPLASTTAMAVVMLGCAMISLLAWLSLPRAQGRSARDARQS